MKTMRERIMFAAAGVFLLVLSSASAQEQGNHRIGGGAHYWTTIDKITDEKFDRNGLSWLASYQYVYNLLKLELGAEIFPNGYYGSKEVTVTPQAFVGIGGMIYAAAGIGTACASDLDNTFSDPFYILRAGLDLELLPGLRLDVNGNYYFTKWDNVSDINTDTITLGAQARYAF